MEVDTNYFRDNSRRIDYILVYKRKLLKDSTSINIIETYVRNLQMLGIKIETEIYSADSDIHFIKLHAPDSVLLEYADKYGIELSFQIVHFRPYVKPPSKIFSNILTRPDIRDPIYQRAPESVSGAIPSTVTTAERITVLDTILSKNRFGTKHGQYGLNKLLKDKIILAAFGLHDGDFVFPTHGAITDRQLLYKFWANCKSWYKVQPLNLIEKYYGSEYAFYFAWLGFYNKMLVPAAILGLLSLFFGLCTMTNHGNIKSKQVCESDLIMCPRCNPKYCEYEYLRNECLWTYLTYLFDNPYTISFAVIMSFWATIFMELWKRREAMLQLRWDLKFLRIDSDFRPEFEEICVLKKFNPITGQDEPYLSPKVLCLRQTFAAVLILFLLCLVLLATIGVTAYRLTVTVVLKRTNKTELSKYSTIMASITGSVISVIFIVIFEMIYDKISMSLTNMEYVRTQVEFDNSYIFKCFAFSFTNYYSAVIYIAFFKGRFFTHPGDNRVWTDFGGIRADLCSATGCIVDLSIQLLIIMTLKGLFNKAVQLIVPLVQIFTKKIISKSSSSSVRWERDFMLLESDRYFLVQEYITLVIQYGFVTFFVAGFPLAPALALINNIIELRVDASKISRNYRRPIPRKVAGLTIWFGILQAVTYMSIVTNGFVIAFTGNVLDKEIYRYQVDSSLLGYLNSTLSVFKTEDFTMYVNHTKDDPEFCYYRGRRYPPDHQKKYQLNDDYWYIYAIRFAFVVVFQHVLFILNGILAYAIPDVPFSVKEQINNQKKNQSNFRINALNQAYLQRRNID